MAENIGPKDPVRKLIARDTVTTNGDETLRAVAGILADERIGAVLVEYPGRDAGVVTERDVVQALADGMDPDEVHAIDVMSSPLARIDAEDRVIDVALRMIEEDIRHMAVVDRGELVGIVSIRDTLPVLAEALLINW